MWFRYLTTVIANEVEVLQMFWFLTTATTNEEEVSHVVSVNVNSREVEKLLTVELFGSSHP